MFLDAHQNVVTAYLWQIQVEEDEVGTPTPVGLGWLDHQLESLGSIPGHAYIDVRVQLLEGFFQETYIAGIVLDN